MVMHGSPVEDYSLEELTKIASDRTTEFELRISPKPKGWEKIERAA
jgi:hypothetical protein